MRQGRKRGDFPERAEEEQAPLWKLLRESLDSAKDYSWRLRAGLKTVAEQFESGNSGRALSNLGLALDGLNWLIGVYDHCRFFLAAPIRLDEETVVQTKLLDALRHLVALSEGGDFDGAAWVVREELLPRVEVLISRVEELSRLRIAPQ
ncbi:MAG: hypothetical protein IJR68_03590 [Fretibacterium sp.]|nr:hypothetical protein [Fretibacterium sp.]MBQ9565504.1 hypothetical protein [Synergistaceae bacterium]